MPRDARLMVVRADQKVVDRKASDGAQDAIDGLVDEVVRLRAMVTELGGELPPEPILVTARLSWREWGK